VVLITQRITPLILIFIKIIFLYTNIKNFKYTLKCYISSLDVNIVYKSRFSEIVRDIHFTSDTINIIQVKNNIHINDETKNISKYHLTDKGKNNALKT
jgi:hypothetical protein